MSYLLLHNGNQLVKPWATEFYNCTPMVCLNDPWPTATKLQEKYQLVRDTSICTDLTTADAFDIKELSDAKQHLEVVKVITSYESDIANLEPVWNDRYDQQQWLVSTFSRLSLADRVVFLQPVVLKCFHNEPPVIFTPGRSGTHVLKNVARVHDYLHHHDNLLERKEFSRIVNSERILSVLRKRFVDQVISDAISKKYGVMVTTNDTLEEHRRYVSTWEPLMLTDSDYKSSLEKICSYVDLLLGLRMFYHKQIEFSLLEDLRAHFDKIDYVKNPYRSQDVISNYFEAVNDCDQRYQPAYNQIINKLQCFFGASVYHYE